ncbi:MAG: BppU family phage baseplate upper protein, partial [Anaerotignum sp.]|nr:BppU family phage baseplate upper protein [Anaerotignum sp.]
AKQNDTKTRYFDITVTDNGTPVDLTDCEVRIYGRKHDGTEFYNNGSLQDPVNGRCLFEATTQMLALAAQDVHCEVVAYKNNEQILSTMPFTIHVVESLIGESAIESSNEYGALVVLYQNLYEAIDLMTMMVKNFGEAGETAAQVPAGTFWEMLEALYAVNQWAMKNASVAEVLERIGLTGDTGGSATVGTLMAKENAIFGKLTDGISVASVNHQTKEFTEFTGGIVEIEESNQTLLSITGNGILILLLQSYTNSTGGKISVTIDGKTVTLLMNLIQGPLTLHFSESVIVASGNPASKVDVGYIIRS